MAKSPKKAAIVAAPLPVLSETQVQYFPLSQIRAKEGYNLRMFDPAVRKTTSRSCKPSLHGGSRQRACYRYRRPGRNDCASDRQSSRCGGPACGVVGRCQAVPCHPVLAVREGQTETEATYDLFVSNNGKPLSRLNRLRAWRVCAALASPILPSAKRSGVRPNGSRCLGSWRLCPTTWPMRFMPRTSPARSRRSCLKRRKRAEGGFDLAKVWERVNQRSQSRNMGRQALRLESQLKHVDPVLKGLGRFHGEKPPHEPVKQGRDRKAATHRKAAPEAGRDRSSRDRVRVGQGGGTRATSGQQPAPRASFAGFRQGGCGTPIAADRPTERAKRPPRTPSRCMPSRAKPFLTPTGTRWRRATRNRPQARIARI
jgi:hypothetical protein